MMAPAAFSSKHPGQVQYLNSGGPLNRDKSWLTKLALLREPGIKRGSKATPFQF